MLKMALIDCASNKKCCSVDGGRDICPLFSVPTPGDLTAQESRPREFAVQGKKMLMPGVSPGGGWAQVELTDALRIKQGENENDAIRNCDVFLNQKLIKKLAMNKGKLLMAAEFPFVHPVEKDS